VSDTTVFLHKKFYWTIEKKDFFEGKTSCKGTVKILFIFSDSLMCFGSKQLFRNISSIKVTDVS
jgi:hypothetical protein